MVIPFFCTAVIEIARSLRRGVAASRLSIAPFLSIRICFGLRPSDFGFPAPPRCASCASSRQRGFPHLSVRWHTRVNDDGYLAGPPELVVEVAASSASIDLRDKRRAYCRNGVREYLVWLVAEARLEWFCLEDDDYRPQLPDAQGVLHSRGFPGLRLPVAPLLAGDTAKVLAALTGTNC